MRCFDTWLNGLESQKYCDNVELEKGVYTLTSGAKTLQLRVNHDGEILIWSKSDPQKLRKVIGSGVEKVLPRLVTEFFTGNKTAKYIDHNGREHVFSNVALAPVAFSAERNETEFADGSGRSWVLANATPDAALGFYKSLQQVRSEHVLFLSSALVPKGTKTAIMSANAPITVLYTIRSLQDTLPKLDDFTLFPGAESLPTLGVAIVSGHTVTAGDSKFIGSANRAVDRFIKSGVDIVPLVNDPVASSSAMPIHPHPGTQPEAVPATDQVKPPNHGFPNNTNLDTLVPKTGPGFEDGQVTDKQVPDGTPGDARKPAVVNSSVGLSGEVKKVLWDAEMLKVQLFSNGNIRVDVGIADPQNCREIFASFHGPANVAALLDCGRRAGFTMQDLQAGVDFTGLNEAKELKGYLASSALKPMATPVTNRRVDTWVLSGAELAAELDRWGLENRNGIFSSMSVLAVDLDGKAGWKKPIQSGYTYQEGDGPERIAVQRYMHGELSAEETRAELIKYGMAPGTITRTLNRADGLKGTGGYAHPGDTGIVNSSAVQGSSGTPAPNDSPGAVPANQPGQTTPSDPNNNIDSPSVPKTGPGFGASQPTDKQVPDGTPGDARTPAVVNSNFDGAAQNAAVAPPEAPIQNDFGGGFDPLALDSDLGRALAFLQANPPREASIEAVEEALSESGQFGDDRDTLSDLAYLSMSELGMPIASAGSQPVGMAKP